MSPPPPRWMAGGEHGGRDSRRGGRRVCHGARATSAPVDHASRASWGRTRGDSCEGSGVSGRLRGAAVTLSPAGAVVSRKTSASRRRSKAGVVAPAGAAALATLVNLPARPRVPAPSGPAGPHDSPGSVRRAVLAGAVSSWWWGISFNRASRSDGAGRRRPDAARTSVAAVALEPGVAVIGDLDLEAVDIGPQLPVRRQPGEEGVDRRPPRAAGVSSRIRWDGLLAAVRVEVGPEPEGLPGWVPGAGSRGVSVRAPPGQSSRLRRRSWASG